MSEREDSEINTLYTTDDEPCHSESDQVNEVSNDLSCIETEEEETIVLRPRSKLSKRPSPRKTGSPRRSSRYQKQNDIENKSEPQNQGDSGVYDSIKVAIQDMTGQVVSAIQNAFTGITKQYRHNNASSQQQKHAKSTTIANNSNSFSKVRKSKPSFTSYSNLDFTSASECDESDDEIFSDACSDMDTNSIDTDVITQSKRSKSKIGFSNAKLPSFTGKEKWEVWINRFEAVANLQNWDNRTKLGELLTRLQGEAGDFVFDQLNSKTLKNYSKLATELKNRFGVFENKRAYKVQFNRRTQKPNEDTADYAAELKRIYDKAYSNRQAKIRQEDLLQRFLMGLSDTEARIYLELHKDPKTIEEAVQEVITYKETTSETHEGNSGKYTKVRQLKKENTNFNKQDSTSSEKDVISVTKDELQKIFDIMYQEKKRNDEIQTSVTGHSRPDERQLDRQPFNVNAPPYVPNGNYRNNNCDRNNNPENIPKCYYCGRPGHYARKCYSNPNRQPDYRNNMANPPRQMNMPYTPPNKRVNPADQKLALKFNENGHKLDNIGVQEPTSSITFSNSKEKHICNSNSKEENISNSNSKEENISNSNSNSKEETSSNSNSKEENISNSNSKEENSSNSNSKEENISNSNSNSKEETSSNSNSKEETSSNSNISSVTLEDTNLVCSNPILGSEQSVASNVIARQVLRSDGVYVEGHIQGSEVNFTVDTGAVRTVLSVYAFNKIPHVNRPILEKSNTLACADGKPLKELGKAIFEIKLGNLCFNTEMIVANIEDEALLGLDVLMKSQWGPADIKLTEGIILLGGHAVHCTQIGQTNKFIRKIYGEAYYEIPPRSENFVDVFIDRLDDDSPETVQDCILQPTEKFSERFPLVMAPCLVNSNSSQANISQDVTCNTSTCSIMNPYMYDQDTVIGSAEVVEHEPKMLLKCEDTLDVNNQIAMRRLQFHDSNLESGKGVSEEEIGRHLTTKEKELTPEPPPTIHFVHVATMLQLHKRNRRSPW
ncbi:unnamed protein product [Mytilus edulis]|uniref:CCHC-type domain-containing protein n=1 Tax=Mytilus edulis TaxID=6550 RepID=A0A8S3T5I5_MYTED|nr:unnamed protein product [Mytilus edulis]